MTSCRKIEVIAIFQIYGQFGAIWKQDSGHIASETYIFSLLVTFCLRKTESRTKKNLFWPKNTDISKLKGPWH